jgi:hypothetical protein
MKAKDIFGLVVRLIGLAFLYQGLSAVPMAVSAFCPRFPHFVWTNFLPAFIMIVWPLLVSYWMVRGAPPLMRLAYSTEPNPQ